MLFWFFLNYETQLVEGYRKIKKIKQEGENYAATVILDRQL